MNRDPQKFFIFCLQKNLHDFVEAIHVSKYLVIFLKDQNILWQ